MSRLNDPLGRSWLRRGYQNPSPSWGQSLPGLWQETPITFIRNVQRLDEYGSFLGDVQSTLWTTYCHAEVENIGNKPYSQDQVSGPLLPYMYVIYTEYPGDLSLLPMHGDYVEFNDAQGQRVYLQVKSVDSPNGANDHLEIQTVGFE